MHLSKELDMEHGYLLHSKGTWKNHAYLSRKRVNGKWVYTYRNSGGTLQKRENNAKINKSLDPVTPIESRSFKTRQEASAKGLEYLRRYNKDSDRLPEVQLAKKRAAEAEAKAKEEADKNKKLISKSSTQTADADSGKSTKAKKEKKTKEKKEKTARASSGSSSGSSKAETTPTTQQNQVSEAELARQREEQRLKEEREKTEKYVKEASVQELALQVMRGQLGNGQERMDKLGDRYSEVQALVNKLMKTKKLGGR